VTDDRNGNDDWGGTGCVASLIFNVDSDYSLYCQYYDTLVYSSRQDAGKDHCRGQSRAEYSRV